MVSTSSAVSPANKLEVCYLFILSSLGLCELACLLSGMPLESRVALDIFCMNKMCIFLPKICLLSPVVRKLCHLMFSGIYTAWMSNACLLCYVYFCVK